MKRLRKLLIFVFSFILLLVLLRGPLYRASVRYHIDKDRPAYQITNPELSALIVKNLPEEAPGPDQVAGLALSLTAEFLLYSSKGETDPNKLVESKQAHCVGYAAMHAATCNFIFRHYNYKTYSAKPVAAHLYLFGENIHNWFKSSFFKDHDIVIVLAEDEEIGYDPSLFDYFYIGRISITGN